MKKSITLTLCLMPLAFLPPAFSQGVNGPSGSGSMSAEHQTESTHPDALSGNSGASREETPTKKPGTPSSNMPVQPGTSTDTSPTVSPSSNRSASGNSKDDAAQQAAGKADKTGKSTTTTPSTPKSK
ncbi:hypothetical protein [Eoetvoesiella caeni]